ncbi:TonB-dependent receptor plug domain-containing protein [bacterium]|nr:TonB-dependent receptor plug domain-containing protein [bacterium]
MKKLLFFAVFIFASAIFGNEKEVTLNPSVESPVDYELNVVLKNDKEQKENRLLQTITEKDLQHANTGFTGDLYREAGVHVQQTAAGQSSPFIRGLTGRETLIMFDDIRINNTIFRGGPNQYSAIIDPFLIGKVDILIGSGSTLYGSDAMGGVLSLQSRKVKAGFRSELIYNSANQGFTGSAYFGVKSGDLGGYVLATGNDTSSIYGSDEVGRQPYTSFHYGALSSKIEWKDSNYGTFTLFGSHFTQLDGYRTDKSKTGDYRTFPEQNHSIFYLKHKYYSESLKTLFQTTFAYQNTLEKYERVKNKALSDKTEDDVDQYSVNFRGNTYLNNLTLYYGLEFNRDLVDSWGLKEAKYLDDSIYDIYGQYLKADYTFNQFTFGIGERFTYVWFHENDGIEYKNGSIIFSAFAQYELNEHYQTALNFFQGFRAPNINDMTGAKEFNSGFSLGSEDITPEYSYTFESTHKISFKGLEVSGAIFYMIFRDFLGRKVLDPKPAQYEEYDLVVQPQNVGQGRSFGAELFVKYNYNNQFEFKGNLSWIRGDMDEEINSTTGETEYNPKSKTPPLSGYLRFTRLHSDSVRFYYQLAYAAKQDRLSNGDISDSRIPEDGTPGYLVHSIGLVGDWTTFGFQVSIENMSDEKYKHHGSGVYGAGRSVIGKLFYNF